MLPLDLLTTTTKQFLEVWKSKNWQSLIEDTSKELNTPCQDDGFNGVCIGCPLERECELVYELVGMMYRNKLSEVLK